MIYILSIFIYTSFQYTHIPIYYRLTPKTAALTQAHTSSTHQQISYKHSDSSSNSSSETSTPKTHYSPTPISGVSSLESGVLFYTSVWREDLQKGYLIGLIPTYKTEILDMGTGSENSSDNQSIFIYNEVPTKDFVLKALQVGDVRVLFRELKSKDGVEAVDAAMREKNVDEIDKEIRKYHRGKVKEHLLRIVIEYTVNKDVALEVVQQYFGWFKDIMAWDTSNAISTVTDLDAMNNPEFQLDSASSKEFVKDMFVEFSSDSTVDPDEEDVFLIGKEFHFDFKFDSIKITGTNEKNEAGNGNELKREYKFFMDMVWDLAGNSWHLVDGLGEGKDLNFRLLDGENNQFEVEEVMTKYYHDLTALWIVIGVVGGLMIIGLIIVIVVCCKK